MSPEVNLSAPAPHFRLLVCQGELLANLVNSFSNELARLIGHSLAYMVSHCFLLSVVCR